MKMKEKLAELNEPENPAKNPAPLSDNELEQITGGTVMLSVNPGPPICFFNKNKKNPFPVPARCTSFSKCPYYNDCGNPQKKSSSDPKKNPKH